MSLRGVPTWDRPTGRLDSAAALAALAALAQLLERAALLADRLGVLLVQCPRTLQVDLAQLRGFAAAVDAAPSAPRQIAFEFRHTAAVADEAVRQAGC